MIEMNEIIPNLWLSGRPHKEDIAQMKEKGIEVVVTMHFERIDKEVRENFDNYKFAWVDFVLLPQPLKLLNKGVEEVAKNLDEGRGVLVHCKQGVHRSVALVGCVLVAEGYSPDEGMEMIKKERLVADPDAWHVKRQIRRYEEYRQKNARL